MEQPFTHPEAMPDDDAIAQVLGDAYATWAATVAMLSNAGATPTWHYYRDGGWLAKATKGSKTIAWLAIDDGERPCGKLTFYFAERLRDDVLSSPGLSDERRQELVATKPIGRSLPVQFDLDTTTDLKQVEAIIAARLALQ